MDGTENTENQSQNQYITISSGEDSDPENAAPMLDFSTMFFKEEPGTSSGKPILPIFYVNSCQLQCLECPVLLQCCCFSLYKNQIQSKIVKTPEGAVKSLGKPCECARFSRSHGSQTNHEEVQLENALLDCLKCDMFYWSV